MCANSWQYATYEEEREHPDLGRYVTYGIAVCDGGGTVCQRIADIYTCKSSVDELAAACTRDQLSPCQLQDVVEDFLVDFSVV